MTLITPQDPKAWSMTPAKAVEALKRPLKFGDAEQIRPWPS